MRNEGRNLTGLKVPTSKKLALRTFLGPIVALVALLGLIRWLSGGFFFFSDATNASTGIVFWWLLLPLLPVIYRKSKHVTKSSGKKTGMVNECSNLTSDA